MPKSRGKKVVSSNRSTLNAKWLNNAMKSIGSASAATFKSIAPNISTTGSDIMSASSTVSSALKGTSASKIGKDLSSNKYVQLAKRTLDQSIKDIKSGNLYNESRAADKFMGDMFGDDFNDFDFGDSGDASVTFNYIDEGDSEESINASLMISDSINKGTQANIAASKATVDALIGISSATISQMQEGFSETNETLSNIDNTLNAILQYHEENTTKFYESAIAAFEKIGGAVAEDNSYISSSDPLDIFNRGGSLNASAYKKYVKKRIKKVVDQSPAGMILPFLQDDDMLEMLVSDPVGGLTKGVIGSMIPKVIEGTLKEVDKTFGELIPNMLVRLGNIENDRGTRGIKGLISKIFGVNLTTSSRINTKEITKDSATFDNVTRNAIVEVLPKYARESTEYLRQIAMKVTKTKEKDSDKLLENAQIFDPRTNAYTTKGALSKELAESFSDAIKNAFTSTDFGKVLERIGTQLNDKDREAYEKTLLQFFTQMTESSTGMEVKEFNFNNEKSGIRDILKRVDKGKGKDILSNAIQYLYDNNIAIGSAITGQLNAKRAWEEQMKDMEENSEVYNLLALGINGDTNIKRFVDKQQGNSAVFKYIEKKKKEQEKENQLYADNKPRFKSSRKLAESGIKDWVDTEEYFKERDLGGQLSGALLGEDFGQGFKNIGGHAKNGMFRVMKGDTRGAMTEFASIFTDQVKSVWDGMNKHFFQPLGEKLLGKDEQGNGTGLFGNVQNGFNDTYKSFIQRINGKDYTNSKGELVKLGVDENGNKKESLVDKATNIFKDVKESIVFTLFGDEKEKDDKKKKSKGALTTFTDSIKAGLKGWKEVIFGEEDPEKAAKLDKEHIKQVVMDNLPNAILGAGAGATVGALSGGSLLGMVIGGPVAGAAIGFAGSFLTKSDKFKDYLFGPEIENPDGTKKRIGGLISEQTQDFFKENKKTIIGGAAIGAVKSIIFPNSVGLLSSIVGGPIAGAAVGAGFSLLKRSQMFQEFLYGNEETGKQGIVNAFKSVFKGRDNSEGSDEDKSFAMKMLGMGVIGAAGGALTGALIHKMGILGAMATPAGPIGAAVLGTAIGIASSGNKFSRMLFGEKDKETGKRKGGLLQRFGNYMHVEIFAPMRSKMQNMFDDIRTTIKFDILENIRLPFIAAADSLKKKFANAKEFLGDKIEKISSAVVEKLIHPFGKVIDKAIVQPVKKVISKATDIVYNATKFMVTAPFRLIGGAAKFMRSRIVKFGKSIGGFIFKKTARVFGLIGSVVKHVANPFINIEKKVIGFIGKRIRDRRDRKAERGYKPKGRIRQFLGNLGSDAWRRDYNQSKEERRKELAENKAAAKRREKMNWNRRQMFKVLKDEKYFTQENYERAMQVAKEQGIKLDWRGKKKDMQFEQDPAKVAAEKRAEALKKSTAQIAKNGDKSDDIEIRSLAESYKTNEILRDIREIARNNGISEERAQEIYDELADARKKDAQAAGVDYDEETGEIKSSDDSTGEEKPKKPTFKDVVKREMEEYSNKIAESGGLKQYAKDFFSIKKGYEGSDLEGYINSGKEKVSSLFAKFGKARAEGGPAKEDDPLLVGDGGKDLDAAEIFVPRSDGQIISQKDGGIKVTLTSIGKEAIAYIKEAIAHPFGKKDKKKSESKKNEKTASFTKNSLTLWRDELEKTNPGAFKKMQEAKKAAEEKEEQKKRDESIIGTLGDIRDNNKNHHNIWASIFSKKGLITLAVVGLAGLVIKNFPAVQSAIEGIARFLGWHKENQANTNGRGAIDQIKDTASDFMDVGASLKNGDVLDATSKFILDNGRYDANSGGRVSLLANGGRKVYKGGKKIVNTVKSGINSVKNGINTIKNFGSKLTGKAVGEAGEEVVQNVTEDSIQMWQRELAENAAETGVKSVTKESAEATVEKTGKTGAKKVLGMFENAIKGIVEKIVAKCPGVADNAILSALKGTMTTVTKTVTEKFAKIAAKITLVTSGKATSHAVTLGLDTVVFCTVGAINGVSGTAKLFQVDEDHVDGKMKIISAAFGALIGGTIVGSIIDIISGLIAEVCGFDLLNTIACCIYGIIAGEDKVDALNAAKEEFQGRYESYKSEEIEKQYNTQKAAGIIGSDVTIEQFQEGISNGTYAADIKSFQDYNADEHQSLGYKIGNAATKGWRSVKSFFGGKKSYTDANGQTYADNGDGTFTVYDANGNNLGNISQDAVDTSTMEKTTKGGIFNTIGDFFGKVGDNIKGFVDGGIDVAKAIGTGFVQIKRNFDNKDMDVSAFFNADVNTLSEDNPMHGLVGGLLNISKYVLFPRLLVHGIMKRIAGSVVNFIKDTAGKVGAVIGNTGSELMTLNQIASSGDLNSLNNYMPTISEDNPIGGITSGLLVASKYLHYPSTLVHYAGNKIGEFMGGVAESAKTSIVNTMSSISSMRDFSKNGDIEGLNNFDAAVDPSTPLSGVINVALKGMKYLMYPSTLVHYAGNKIGEFIGEGVGKAANIGADIKDYATRLLSYEDPEKSMDGFDKEVMGDETDITTKLISPMIRSILKVYVNFKRAINQVGDAIADKIGDIKDFLAGGLDNAKSYANGDNEGGAGVGRKLGGRGTEPSTDNGFAYYSQDDPRWRDKAYISGMDDGSTMGNSGCGPTAMAMVASQAAKGKSITPTQMASMASATGFRDDTGTNERFISYAGDTLGLSHVDVENPSGDFIRNSVNSGNPVVLNGVSSDNSAFTPAGHYVVAVGTDQNGNVLVNDPRGSQYNTSYSPDQLASQTRKAWSFGGHGFHPIQRLRKKFGGRGLNGDWLSIVKSVKRLIAAQHPTYSQSNYITINYNGTELKVRTDCSGYVGACLQLYGAIPTGQNVTSNSLLSQNAISSGFTYGGWTGWENLKEGDIISKDGHVEIFAKNEGNNHYVYSNGSTKTIASPEPTVTGHPEGYSVVWRPGNAGTGANVVSVDGTASTGSSTGVSSSNSSSNGVMDVLGKVTNVFTKFASKAMNGILTGNWDYNFSDDATTASTGSAGSVGFDSGNATVSGGVANISGSDTSEKLYNFLTSHGVTPAGASGMLGNLYKESGVQPNNLQNTSNSKLGMSDDQYTQAVDNGSYGNFVNDSAGYGLAQWTSPGRKEALLNLAKSNNKSIGDPDVQITHLWNELNGSYKNNVLTPLMSTDDVTEASNIVLTKFERPKNQSDSVKQERASVAQSYYNLYANKSPNTGANTSIVTKGGQTLSAYGPGPGKQQSQKMFGGRGFVEDVSISNQQDRYPISKPARTSENMQINTSTLETLLNTAINVLRSIDTNTSKIDSLQAPQVSSVNNGGNNIIVSGGNNQSSDKESLNSYQPSTSTNSKLAQQIAKGV